MLISRNNITKILGKHFMLDNLYTNRHYIIPIRPIIITILQNAHSNEILKQCNITQIEIKYKYIINKIEYIFLLFPILL